MARRKTHDEFCLEIKERYGDKYTVLGKYESTHTPILMKCNNCGNVWDTTAPYDLLKPHPNGCPNCASHKSKRKTQDEFEKEIFDLVGDEYSVLGKYVNKKTPVLFRHNKCGHEWEVKPNNFLSNGTRCPKCKSSKGEIKVSEILEKLSIPYEAQKHIKEYEGQQMDHCLKFDFYIESFNLAIEYDGELHYLPKRGENELLKTQERDKRKNEYCKEKGIELLRIPYWEFKNIETIIKTKIETLK